MKDIRVIHLEAAKNTANVGSSTKAKNEEPVKYDVSILYEA
jgi:hypothetical protein